MICAVVWVWRGVEVSGFVHEFMRPALINARIIQLIHTHTHTLIRWREENTALVCLKRI